MADLPVIPGSQAVSYGPLIGDLTYALISKSSRAIDTIIPDVVVEEVHHDELRITEHPVELGAEVADHAFKVPYEVQMRIGFSNSSAQAEGFVQQVYLALLALQQQREPFNVTTGKRQYTSMLLRMLTVITDPSSEWALNCVANLRQVIITSTTGFANPANMKDPQQTSQQENNGNKNLTAPVIPVESQPISVLGPTSAPGAPPFGTVSPQGDIPPWDRVGATPAPQPNTTLPDQNVQGIQIPSNFNIV